LSPLYGLQLIFNKYTISSILWLGLAFSAFAQKDSIILKQEISQLRTTWETYKSYAEYPQWGTDIQKVETLFGGTLRNNDAYLYENDVHRAKAAMYHSDPGLSMNASFLQNFTPSLNEDDDNLIYQRRLQAGLNWDVLGNGFFENRAQEQMELNSIRINEYLSSGESKEKSYSVNWNTIIYIFNKAKLEVLQQRRDLLNELSIEAERLHLSRYLSREDYIRVLSSKAEIEGLTRVYEDYNLQFGSGSDTLKIQAADLPLLDIRYASVFYGLDSSSRDSISNLYLENLQLQYRFMNDLRLSTFLRYNYYDLIVPGNRSFFSLGVNFSMPIPFRMNQRNELIEARAKESMYILSQKFEGKQKELLNECYEYRYKLKQYISFHQKFILYQELLRKMNATLRLDPLRFNPIEGLTLLDDMLAVKMELLDIRQSLYLKLLRIYTMSGRNKTEEIAQSFDIPNYFDLDAMTEKSVYIWSTVLAKKSVEFVAEYIRYNKFDKVVISLNRDEENTRKIRELITLIPEVDVHLMIGDNQFIQKNPAEELAFLLKNFTDSTIKGIHLDVEPHTFPDWDSKKESYLQSYQAMLLQTGNYCKEHHWELSVSVPLHYPEENMKSIFSLCDKVYFMAYENIKPEYIERKIAPYSALKDKIVVALRTKDFGTKSAMEKYMIDMYHKNNYDQFAIHDLGGLIEMDERNLR